MDATIRRTWSKGTRLVKRLRKSIRKLKSKLETQSKGKNEGTMVKMDTQCTEEAPPIGSTFTIHSVPIYARPPSRPASPPFNLLGLPRELRDQIYSFVFDQAGMSYVREQLLGFPSGDHTNHSITFRALLTCQQIYNEAFPIAYRSTCFYWFKPFTLGEVERLLLRLNERQAQNVRHIAFWSNPYACENFQGQIPSHLRLAQVTVCSNYMSGALAPALLETRVTWILKNLRRLKTLKRFCFLTGCGVAPEEMRKTDYGLAVDLRKAFGWMHVLEEERVEVGKFNEGSCTAVVRLLPREGKEERARDVCLKVASVYEDAFTST
jgi:hypothetical protein